MRGAVRGAVAALALALALAAVVVGCSGEDTLPDAQDVRDIDLSPTSELVIDSSGAADLEIRARTVLAIRNDDDVTHRLVGDGLDTGALEPGDETLVTFPEAITISWRDHGGDLEGTITVLAAEEP